MKNQNKSNLFKIISINLFSVLFIIVLIELIFGYWFDKDNFGPFMREHRNKNNSYTLKYKGEIYEYVYKRNYYGFRGEHVEPDKIKAIMVSGSTGEERYKPDRFTITELLNLKLKDSGIDLKIINASIGGQSTRGHIGNFITWYSKLENFFPKYILYYIGVNDSEADITIKADNLTEAEVLNPKPLGQFMDNIKSRSIFSDVIRKFRQKYYTSKTEIVYDFDNAMKVNKVLSGYKFLNYHDALKYYDINAVFLKHDDRIKYYLKNVDTLYKLTTALGAEPIFINTLLSDGYYNEILFSLNLSLTKHCEIKNYKCIDVARKLEGKEHYWWDQVHTTTDGSKAISDLIYPDLIKIISH